MMLLAKLCAEDSCFINCAYIATRSTEQTMNLIRTFPLIRGSLDTVANSSARHMVLSIRILLYHCIVKLTYGSMVVVQFKLPLFHEHVICFILVKS